MGLTAEEIKKIRQTIGLTQRDFANLLQTQQATIYRWESGKVSPSQKFILKLKKLAKNQQNST